MADAGSLAASSIDGRVNDQESTAVSNEITLADDVTDTSETAAFNLPEHYDATVCAYRSDSCRCTRLAVQEDRKREQLPVMFHHLQFHVSSLAILKFP